MRRRAPKGAARGGGRAAGAYLRREGRRAGAEEAGKFYDCGALVMPAQLGIVQALVFGHFGEFNDGLLKLADAISKSVAKQHHRMLGFKSEDAGRSRAKAGVMRRLSMVALRSTARHVLRGLAVVGPPCIHQHNARETARRAHHDAFGNDRGAPWRNPTDGGG